MKRAFTETFLAKKSQSLSALNESGVSDKASVKPPLKLAQRPSGLVKISAGEKTHNDFAKLAVN